MRVEERERECGRPAKKSIYIEVKRKRIQWLFPGLAAIFLVISSSFISLLLLLLLWICCFCSCCSCRRHCYRCCCCSAFVYLFLFPRLFIRVLLISILVSSFLVVGMFVCFRLGREKERKREKQSI